MRSQVKHLRLQLELRSQVECLQSQVVIYLRSQAPGRVFEDPGRVLEVLGRAFEVTGILPEDPIIPELPGKAFEVPGKVSEVPDT